jgi:hypothetical protein
MDYGNLNVDGVRKKFGSIARHNKEKKGAQGEAECAGCVICVNVKNPYSVLSSSEIFSNLICVRIDSKLGDCEKC